MDYSLKYYDLFWVGFFVKNPVECDRLNLIIMDHFLPFYFPPPKNPINQSFEKMKKKCWRYYHLTHVYQKPQSYEVQFLR